MLNIKLSSVFDKLIQQEYKVTGIELIEYIAQRILRWTLSLK